MITSKELLNVAEGRDINLTYGQIRSSMVSLGIIFKARRVDGHVIRTYLTAEDVVSIGDTIGVDFNWVPPRTIK